MDALQAGFLQRLSRQSYLLASLNEGYERVLWKVPEPWRRIHKGHDTVSGASQLFLHFRHGVREVPFRETLRFASRYG
jgi:hypothetical protein